MKTKVFIFLVVISILIDGLIQGFFENWWITGGIIISQLIGIFGILVLMGAGEKAQIMEDMNNDEII